MHHATIFSDPKPMVAPARAVFLGTGFDLSGPEVVADALARATPSDPFRYIVTPNVEHVARLARDPSLRAIYDAAAMLWCDSRPISALARMMGLQLPHLTGADMTLGILENGLRPGDPVTAILADDKLLDRLRARYPLAQWRGISPPMGFEKDPAAIAQLVDFVAQAPARFIFIAVGSPRSEMLAAAIAEDGRARGLALCIGAALEFATGRKRRAPRWMRAAGLEWLHRLGCEPGRLWRRYLGSAPTLARLVAREAALRWGRRASPPLHVPQPTPQPAPNEVRGGPARVLSETKPLVLHVVEGAADPVDAIDGIGARRVATIAHGAQSLRHGIIFLEKSGAGDLRDIDFGHGGRIAAFAVHHPRPVTALSHLLDCRVRSHACLRFLRDKNLLPDVVHVHGAGAAEAIGRRIAARRGLPLLGAAATGPELLAPTPLPTRPHSAIVPSGRFLIAAADLDDWQGGGLATFLWAFAITLKRHDDLLLDIIGAGDADHVEHLWRRIRELDLQAHVRIRAPLHHTALMRMAARASAFVAIGAPSLHELAIEAVMAGAPLIHGGEGDLAGAIGSASAALVHVNPWEVQDVADALAHLFEDEDHVCLESETREAGALLRHRYAPERVGADYARRVADALAGMRMQA